MKNKTLTIEHRFPSAPFGDTYPHPWPFRTLLKTYCKSRSFKHHSKYKLLTQMQLTSSIIPSIKPSTLSQPGYVVPVENPYGLQMRWTELPHRWHMKEGNLRERVHCGGWTCHSGGRRLGVVLDAEESCRWMLQGLWSRSIRMLVVE